jgi:hypothetical protein
MEWTKHMIIHTGQTRTIWRMLQHLEVLLPKGVNDMVGNLQIGHFHAKIQHPLLAFLGVLFQYLVSTNLGATDCNTHCLLLCASLDIVPEMVLVSPRRVPTPLSADCCILNFLIHTWSSSLHHATVTLSLHLFCDLYYNLNPSLSSVLPQVLLRHSTTHCQVGLLSL